VKAILLAIEILFDNCAFSYLWSKAGDQTLALLNAAIDRGHVRPLICEALLYEWIGLYQRDPSAFEAQRAWLERTSNGLILIWNRIQEREGELKRRLNRRELRAACGDGRELLSRCLKDSAFCAQVESARAERRTKDEEEERTGRDWIVSEERRLHEAGNVSLVEATQLLFKDKAAYVADWVRHCFKFKSIDECPPLMRNKILYRLGCIHQDFARGHAGYDGSSPVDMEYYASAAYSWCLVTNDKRILAIHEFLGEFAWRPRFVFPIQELEARLRQWRFGG
jgi:hypothetical protein